MHTQQLTVNQQDRSHEVERSEEAILWAEVASRLVEIREKNSSHRVLVMISRLHALSLIHPEAFWMVVSLLTGDLSQVTRSYMDIGKEQGKTKQAVEQERSRALDGIQQHFPKLATALIELRHITSENRAT